MARVANPSTCFGVFFVADLLKTSALESLLAFRSRRQLVPRRDTASSFFLSRPLDVKLLIQRFRHRAIRRIVGVIWIKSFKFLPTFSNCQPGNGVLSGRDACHRRCEIDTSGCCFFLIEEMNCKMWTLVWCRLETCSG